MIPNPDTLIFFLGGYDLEMVTIRELLQEVAPGRFYDHELAWGATTAAYQQEIARTLAQGLTPVCIELIDTLALDPSRVIFVDHHGERAGASSPTSLHQVFDLLQLPPERWTRWFDLVAANDAGYIPAMLELGASPQEIRQIRAADRAAQGITPEEERQGARAAALAETRAHGQLTLVRLPHSRTATVSDRLQPELGGPGYQNLLVYSPDQVNFFGSGKLVRTLAETFTGGWCGGDLPQRGFWGHAAPMPDVLPLLLHNLKKATQPR